MTKEEFIEQLKVSANIAVQRANKFLGQLDLSLHINWKYEDWEYYGNAIGIYERDSVLEGNISIGFNIDNLYKWFVNEIKENPWSDQYTILDEAIQTNVFHEMGHGIVQLLEDTIEYWDEDEELPFYDNNQQFCDNVLDNEEDSVEKFAWAMYDNQLNNSKLYKLIQLYLEFGNTQNNNLTERNNGKVGFGKYIIKRKSQPQANKLNENLFTHDDEYNIYEKLDELDITYDFINDRENIIEIDIPDEATRKKVSQILNYYGWKNIKETKYSIYAERIYGDKWNDFYDEEAEDDDDEGYPFGVGIYYHITTSNKVPKILKQGLTVREGNKLGYARGERIYLISYPNKFLAHDLCRHMTGKINITILLVDIRKYLGKQINIYHDDFTADEGAVYTYDYIPPQCIKVYDNFIVDKKSQPQAVAESLTNGIFKNFKLMID